MPTVSIVKGHGYSKHNDRSIKNIDPENRSWNPELSSQNIVIKNENIKQKYHDLFDDALEKYNAKQTQSSRQIKNYYEKISRSKQEKTFYELIVSIGDMESIPKGSDIEKQAIKAINEYAEGFAGRNKNFKVFQNIIHLDEKGVPHVHIDFIPVSTGNKRGLETKNSLGGALKEMGFGRNGFESWRAKELDTMVEIMKTHDLEYEVGTGRTEHFKRTSDYKQYVEERDAAKEQIQNLQLEIDQLEEEKNDMLWNPEYDVSLNPEVKKIMHDCLAFKPEKINLDYLDDGWIEIKTTSLSNKKIVSMPYNRWEKIKSEHNQLIDNFKNLKLNFFDELKKIKAIFSKIAKSPVYISIKEFLDLKEQYKKILDEKKYYQEKFEQHKTLSKKIKELYNIFIRFEKKLTSLSDEYFNSMETDEKKINYLIEDIQCVTDDYLDLFYKTNELDSKNFKLQNEIEDLENKHINQKKELSNVIDTHLKFIESYGLESEFYEYLQEQDLMETYQMYSNNDLIEKLNNEYDFEL